MADPSTPVLWVTLSTQERRVGVYADGSCRVRSVKAMAASVARTGAEAGLDATAARGLVDRLAAATGYYPEDPSLDAHREKIRELAAELVEVRFNGDTPESELAELALSRHAGQLLAEAARTIYGCRDHMTDYTVGQIAAELVGMVDAMIGAGLTNPESRINAHMARIETLATHLPRSGHTPGGPR